MSDNVRVTIEFPAWMIEALDEEAERLGIARVAVAKWLIDEGLRRKQLEQNKLGD